VAVNGRPQHSPSVGALALVWHCYIAGENLMRMAVIAASGSLVINPGSVRRRTMAGGPG
jgi:hypothetical protein